MTGGTTSTPATHVECEGFATLTRKLNSDRTFSVITLEDVTHPSLYSLAGQIWEEDADESVVLDLSPNRLQPNGDRIVSMEVDTKGLKNKGLTLSGEELCQDCIQE